MTDGMEATIAIYLGTLLRLVDERRLEIYVHPVVPVLNETRSIVKTFNDIMRKRVRAGGGGGVVWSCGCVVVWLCGCVAHEDAGGMRCGVVCGVVRCGSVTVLSSVGGAGVVVRVVTVWCCVCCVVWSRGTWGPHL